MTDLNTWRKATATRRTLLMLPKLVTAMLAASIGMITLPGTSTTAYADYT